MYDTFYENEKLRIRYNISTGGIDSVSRNDDPSGMNFVRSKIGFGVPKGRHSPDKISISNGIMSLTFQYFNYVDCEVIFRPTERGITGHYLFKNVGKEPAHFEKGELGVYLTFSEPDDIPFVSVNRRVISHMFCGGNTAYVFNDRIDDCKQSMSLVVTKGAVWEYGKDNVYKRTSFGEKAFCFEEMTLNPDESYEFEWLMFETDGFSDFEGKAKEYCALYAKSSKFIYGMNEQGSVTFNRPFKIIAFEGADFHIEENVLIFSFSDEGEKLLSVADDDGNVIRIVFYIKEELPELCERSVKFYNGFCQNEGLVSSYTKGEKAKKEEGYCKSELSLPAYFLFVSEYFRGKDEEKRKSETAKIIVAVNAKLCLFSKGRVKKIHTEKGLIPFYMEIFYEYYKLTDKQAYLNYVIGMLEDFCDLNEPMYLYMVYRLIMEQKEELIPKTVKDKLLSLGYNYMEYLYFYPKRIGIYSEKTEAQRCLTLAIRYELKKEEKTMKALLSSYRRLSSYYADIPDCYSNFAVRRTGDGSGSLGKFADTAPSKNEYNILSALSALKNYVGEAKSDYERILDTCVLLFGKSCCQCLCRPSLIEGKRNEGCFFDSQSNGEQYLLYLLLKERNAEKSD